MPVVLLERIPLPSLSTYTIVSISLLTSAFYYAHLLVLDADSRLNNPQNDTVAPNGTHGAGNYTENVTIPVDADLKHDDVVSESTFANVEIDQEKYVDGMVTILVGEPWCVWTLVNMACCCLLLLGKLIQKVVFGELRVIEKQHVKDKFWNFVFYKFIFVFGILNVQDVVEMVPWCSWFAVLCLLHLLAQLCKDRFEYLSFSPTTPLATHVKVVSLLVLINVSSCALLVLCAYVGYMYAGINTFAFMAAECILLTIKTQNVLTKYAIHLCDVHHDGVWENRASYVYYSELVFELAALSLDFMHHIHMLIWGNIILSMASLVICMQLRYLFHEFQRRIRRHKNYRRVVTSMEAKFPLATPDDLDMNNDDCAICWEKMESARKLPCGHLFHNACLRSWLEQDTTCPTCRTSLSELQRREHPPAPPANPLTPPGPNPPDTNQTTTNHFFHFDGSRYVSWFPSFSVEVSHTQLMGGPGQANVGPIRATAAQTSLLDNMTRQVHEVFPHIPLSAILDDLHVTRSVELSIENIIEGRLHVPQNLSTRPVDSEEPPADGHPIYQPDTTSTMTSDPTSMQLSPPTDRGHWVGFTDFNLPDPSGEESAEEESSEAVRTSGGRFSKSSSERELMLAQRKEQLLQIAQKKFLEKQRSEEHDPGRSDNLTQLDSATPIDGEQPSVSMATTESDSDSRNQRELVYRAAQRRLHPN